MKYLCAISGVLCILLAGRFAFIGVMDGAAPKTVFVQLVAICCLIVSTNLLIVATNLWIAYAIFAIKMPKIKQFNESYLSAILESLHEIRDRGYDAVDRLDELNQRGKA